MSWQLFKQNILRRMDNPQSITDVEQFADLITNEYDLLIKKGTDTFNLVPFKRGNKSALKNGIQSALNIGLQSRNPYTLINSIGNAVILYWTGAELQNTPPITPAPGSIQNLSSSSNVVLNPGVWPPTPPIPPTQSTSLFIDTLVLAGQQHLTTVSGIATTTSLYPSTPSPIPLPGSVAWFGFTVPL